MDLNLIQLFTFYLTAAFFISTVRRIGQYHDISQLVLSAPSRWPRTLDQVRKHRMIFFTWTTLRPAAVAIGLMLTQMICSRLIWPQAHITLNQLLEEWWMFPLLATTSTAMLGVDLYFIIRVAKFDRKSTEKYLDEAEYWLTSWKAPVVRTLTLGYLNPRMIVDKEVQNALIYGNDLLGQTLWWIALQSGCRILFGLTLWISWAMLPVGV